MSIYGLDFGTTTTWLADGSDGSAISRDLTKGQAWMSSDVDESGLVGAGSGSRSAKRYLYSEGFVVSESISPAAIQKLREDHAKEQPKRFAEVKAILTEVVGRAKKLGIDLTKENSTRLGCPAVWDAEARRNLIRLATEAGIGLVDQGLTEEAVAAGVDWIDRNPSEAKTAGKILVFDMGGGTLDIAVIKLDLAKDTGKLEKTVLASVGNLFAGDNVDETLLRQYKEKHPGITLDADSKLIWAVKTAKEQLSTNAQVEFTIHEASKTTATLKVEDLLLAMEPMLKAAKDEIYRALGTAGLMDSNAPVLGQLQILEAHEALTKNELASEIGAVLLVGGMTKAQPIVELLKAQFPKAKLYSGSEPLAKSIPNAPLEIVSLGLANSAQYGSLNLDRAAFTVKLAGVKDDIYSAYQPIVDWQKVDNTAGVIRFVKNLNSTVQGVDDKWGAVTTVKFYKPDGVTPLKVKNVASTGLEDAEREINKSFDFTLGTEGMVALYPAFGSYSESAGKGMILVIKDGNKTRKEYLIQQTGETLTVSPISDIIRHALNRTSEYQLGVHVRKAKG